MNDISEQLSYYLRAYMKKNRITQEQLAEKMGVSICALRCWIGQKQLPNNTSWKRIIDALGEPARQIMLNG